MNDGVVNDFPGIVIFALTLIYAPPNLKRDSLYSALRSVMHSFNRGRSYSSCVDLSGNESHFEVGTFLG